MDIVGHFQWDHRGQQFLLTSVAHFTGWAEAIPLASKKSAMVWDAYSREIVARNGLPRVLVTDNGGEFTEKIFAEWVKENGIDHRLTSPYHPQSR